MYLNLFLFFLTLYISVADKYSPDLTDNEFAEFEDFEVEDDIPLNDISEKSRDESKEATLVIDDQDIIIDDDDSEFEHFQDNEEFEGFEIKDEKPIAEPKITIAKIPINFRQNWDSYYLEILMILGLVVYFINFATGKSKNTKIANTWFQTHRQLLEENFSLVGDDNSLDNNENVHLIKESENIFTLWCSGRTCCEGMLVELKLLKRQDLVAIISGMMRPVLDQIHITVRMNKEDMDSFVFCIASKKTAQHLSKEMADLSVFCPERKSGDKFNINAGFNVMSEIAEAASAMLDSKVIAVLNKFQEYVDYIHFSDQFSGLKQTEDSGTLKLPETEKVLMFGFNILLKGMTLEESMIKLQPLMNMVFYCMDKVKRFRLSKEGKTKADKNRQRVEEAFLKSTHQARAEAAAARREEKRRQEKEKVMADEDPERQRRWELKEEKRQAKKRAPKMKQLKVKAL
ncbi:coiled-coil domain-containing protein 47 [Anoplophora glabripennis]|uniref:coiled-coil domain-containing protein 47 n=1 Tax=Anoplophora glabripennis TaxID=217634 RepID=UPI0008754BE7|nr:coiled-coil domain-containing protein 47 [Anoplophora glabripennis]